MAPLRTDSVALVEGPGFLQGLSGLVGHSLARRERKAGQGEDLPCREGEHAAATAGKERALKLRSSETTDGQMDTVVTLSGGAPGTNHPAAAPLLRAPLCLSLAGRQEQWVRKQAGRHHRPSRELCESVNPP